jgi:hypothetical protein
MNSLEVVNQITKTMPYPQHITMECIEVNAVRFKWRGHTYRVSTSLSVEEVEDGCLVGNDRAILVEHILKEGHRI